jgi:hypothetical protein
MHGSDAWGCFSSLLMALFTQDVTLLSDLPEAKKEMACFHSMNVA